MIFEWDDNKNRINKQKHGVSFETASRIFLDPFLIVTEDTAHNEVRWLGVGSMDGVVVLLVVHTHTDTDGTEVIRIISARKLSKGEIERYGYC